jgi:hypothetical protein
MAGASMGEESTHACRKLSLGAKCSRFNLISQVQVADEKREKT